MFVLWEHSFERLPVVSAELSDLYILQLLIQFSDGAFGAAAADESNDFVILRGIGIDQPVLASFASSDEAPEFIDLHAGVLFSARRNPASACKQTECAKDAPARDLQQNLDVAYAAVAAQHLKDLLFDRRIGTVIAIVMLELPAAVLASEILRAVGFTTIFDDGRTCAVGAIDPDKYLTHLSRGENLRCLFYLSYILNHSRLLYLCQVLINQ